VERTVYALFDDVLAVQRVAVALERHGFPRETMSTLASDPRGRYTRKSPNGDEGARAFLPVAIPHLGPAAVSGPLTAAFADGGVGLIDSLTNLGFSEPDARHYYESLRRGQALFALELPGNRVDDAVEVMRKLGARAVDETANDSEDEPAPAIDRSVADAAPAAVVAPAVEPAPVVEPVPVVAPTPAVAPPPVAAPTPTAAQAPSRENIVDQVTVPVVEEQLEVGKRQVNRGGVRIRSQIIEEPIQQSVSLREERITVERRPVYREATEADLADFKEGTIEVHEVIEEPVISKRRRVVEEIVVGREARERTATISETVRRTQVNVEPLPDDAG